MEWGITYGLVLIVLLASIASVGWDTFEMRNRECWWWTGILMLEVLLMPNLWMAAVLAVIIIGLFQIGRSWFILRSMVIPVAGLAGAYIAIVPHMRPWMIVPVLWAGVVVGVFLGCWGLLGVKVKHRPFQYNLPKSWCGMWGIYEHSPEPSQRHLCGQGNQMHLMAVCALTAACSVGLALIGHWWALLFLPLCVTPIVLTSLVQGNWHPNQGMLLCGLVALGLVILYWPVVGLSLLAVCIMAMVALIIRVKPWTLGLGWWDSGRMAYWMDAVRLVWWPQGWKHRLFGFGTSTWFAATVRMGEQRHPNVFTAAHNEMVQQMVEHGIVGLLVLCAYFADAFWRTAHGGPEGQAVFLLGMVSVGIALVNFPWAWYHEYHPVNMKEQQWFGSPTLNAWAFIVALLVEAF